MAKSDDFAVFNDFVKRTVFNDFEKRTLKMKNLPVINITDEQREWLEKEKERTGNNFAVTIRLLIQEKIDKDKKDG